jgi:hypothetical protein
MYTQRFAFLYRGVFLAAVLLAAATHASDARAQSVEPIDNPARANGLRTPAELPYWISRQDCLNNDILTFEVPLTGPFVEYTLEVWAGGTDCSPTAARTGPAPTCWLLARVQPTQTPMTIPLRAQDIVAHNTPDSVVPSDAQGIKRGTLDDCTDSGSSPPQKLVLDFMLVSDASGVATPAHQMFNMGYDIWGPEAPTDVSALAGTARLKLSWTPSVSSDVTGYKVYCDPPPGASAPVDPGTFVACASDAFVPGDLPDGTHEPYLAGMTTGVAASSAVVDGLSNGTAYVVSLAGVDQVGNAGVFSLQACATPQAGADPPPRAKDDSLCSISRVDTRSSWSGVGWIVMAIGVGRGRRKEGGGRRERGNG